MKKNKPLSSFFVGCVLTLCVIAAGMPKTTEAKLLYVITDQNTGELATYVINADGTVSNPTPFSIPDCAAGSVGLAVDANSATLFVSYETSGDPNFAIVDATTLELISLFNDPQWASFTGIDIDDVNNIFYATHRFPDSHELPTGLYAYDWDPHAKTLSPRQGNPIDITLDSGSCVGFGLAVDEINGRLYVAHYDWGHGPSYVGVYELGTWEEIMRIEPSLPCVGLAVDRMRGFVYTTAQDERCCVAPGPNTLLSQYNLATGVETTVDMGHGGMGIAVDETTGYVYVTGGCSQRNLSVWNSDLVCIQTIDYIGPAPAGIAIGNMSMREVDIDIKPGSDPNSINLGSGGTVAVAIFSTTDFDATTVNPEAVTLASAPVRLKGKGTPMVSFEDIDEDGLLDMVVHVSTQTLELSETDETAVLEGKTFDDILFRGMDTVRIVP